MDSDTNKSLADYALPLVLMLLIWLFYRGEIDSAMTLRAVMMIRKQQVEPRA